MNPHKSTAPNVILINVDALRPDYLGCYGYKRGASPNIDRLAEGGAMFTQAIAQASWSPPSNASIMTSTFPSTHKIYDWNNSLPTQLLTMAEILKGYGYYNVSYNGRGRDLFELGLGRGFDIWSDNESIIEGGGLTKSALSFLDGNKNFPFFLWIYYMDTHDVFMDIPKEKRLAENITPDEFATFSLKYDKAIGFADSQIGAILDKLKSSELYENTVIILTSDHGQEMCEHALCFHHGGYLWDSLIRVPLIISYSGSSAKNKLIVRQVQTIDILPTLCDILKIKKPKSFEGRSLLPLIKGKNMQKYFAFSEYKEYKYKEDSDSRDWNYTRIAVRSPAWKLIYSCRPGGEGYELYNLKTDTRELNNLAESGTRQLVLMKRELEKWMGRPKAEVAPVINPLDEETRRRLKSLGYLH